MGRKGWFQTRYQNSGGGGIIKPSNFAVLPASYKVEYYGGGHTSILPSSYSLSYEKVGDLSILPSNYKLNVEHISGYYNSVLPSSYKEENE